MVWFSMNEWIMLGIGLVLTVGTGLFVAAEFALVNLDRTELENQQRKGVKGLGATIKALRMTSTHLSSAQLGITLTTLLTGYTFEPAVSSLLVGPLVALGLPVEAVPAIGSVVGILLATLFSMVIGELVPKNFALALPLQTAKLVIPFQTLFTTVFKPIVLFFNNAANAVVRLMGIEPKEELSGARSAQELSYLIRHSETSGLLAAGDAKLLHKTLRFSRHDAAELMTPRVRITSVDLEDSAAAIIAVAQKTGYSRFPVIRDSADIVAGFVHVKHAFAVDLALRETVKAHDLMVDACSVPETMMADTLLPILRTERYQMVLVVDEYGGTAGIVTLEDVAEEILGEIIDEHDKLGAGIARQNQSILFAARLRPDELFERTGIKIPEDDEYDTVGGFFIMQLGRLPELGDEVRIDGGALRIETLDKASIVRLCYTPDTHEDERTTRNILEPSTPEPNPQDAATPPEARDRA